MADLAPAELSCKVLVIGGGLAAASAARTAISFCTSVIVACKGAFGRSGSSPWRMTAFSQQEVSRTFRGNPSVMSDTYVLDIIDTGHFINDQHLVDLISEIAQDPLGWSEWFGFDGRARERVEGQAGGVFDGKPLRFVTPGHSFARTTPFEGTCENYCAANRDAIELWGGQIFENLMITRLLTAGGRVVGAAGFDVKTGQPYRIQAKSVILCSGGASVLYQPRRGEGETTGDSYALAHQAGAPLSNMEFVQFSPYPADSAGQPLPHHDDLLYFGLGGTLLNSRGERFMKTAELLMDQIRLELAPVANLVTEIQHQLSCGLGPVHSPGGEIAEDNPGLPYLRNLAQLNKPGYDWRVNGFDWTIGVERLLGGLKIDYRHMSPLQGLYSNGEASTGATGADCLPGYGEAFTMGGASQSGAMAARHAVTRPDTALPADQLAAEEQRLRALGGSGERLETAELAAREDELRTLAWQSLGIYRNEDQLLAAQARFSAARSEFAGRSAGSLADFQRKLELENLALTGGLIATAALHRRESRGQHRREDFPNGDDRVWLKELLLTPGSNGHPAVTESPVALPRYKSRHVAHVENIYSKFPR